MIDVVGAIVLSVLAVSGVGTLLLASPLGGVAARRLAVVAGAWFAAVTALAAGGIFSSSAGTPAIGVAVAAPVVIVALSATRVPLVRTLALGIPVSVLVAVNAGRGLGIFFLLLNAEGRLPRTFAATAGWGDIAAGALALPLAWAIHRRVGRWPAMTLAWNAFGFLDLLTAVTLGVGSAAGSPLRFIYESPDSAAMGTLPWLLIPGFLVPLYLLTHLAVFAQLARGAGAPLPARRPAR